MAEGAVAAVEVAFVCVDDTVGSANGGVLLGTEARTGAALPSGGGGVGSTLTEEEEEKEKPYASMTNRARASVQGRFRSLPSRRKEILRPAERNEEPAISTAMASHHHNDDDKPREMRRRRRRVDSAPELCDEWPVHRPLPIHRHRGENGQCPVVKWKLTGCHQNDGQETDCGRPATI